MQRFILFLSVCFLASCNSPEKLICRAWQVNNVAMPNASSQFDKDIQKQLQQNASNYHLVFSKDSVYEMKQKEGDVKGKWWFNTGKKGFHSEAAGTVAEAKIVELSHNKLVFDATDKSGREMIVTCSPLKGSK